MNTKTAANSRSFLIPQTYLFGPGSAGEHLSTLEENTLFLITDVPAMERAGHLSRIMDILRARRNRRIEILSIESEPSFRTVEDAVQGVRGLNPDRIIALGGGSVLDTAKALWRLTLDTRQDPRDFLVSGPSIPKEGPSSCSLSAVPTTSGTGSEGTCAAVFTEGDTGMKRLLLSPLLIPSAAVLDPTLTLSMPSRVAAVSGFDALVHAAESFLCTIATPFSKGYAAEAIRLILNNLEDSCRDGDNLPAREAVHYAAGLAGLAISNSCTGLTHSLDQVGVRFHMAHGMILAPLMIPMLELVMEQAPLGLQELASAAGLGTPKDEGARLFIERTAGLISSLGLPRSFRETGIEKGAYDQACGDIVPTAVEAFATRVFPSDLKERDLSLLLEKAYG